MEIKVKVDAPALVEAINSLAVAIAGVRELQLHKETKELPTKQAPKKENALSIDDIRKVFIEKNKDRSNTPKLKALLEDYKVEKVTDLPEKHFAEILKKLEGI